MEGLDKNRKTEFRPDFGNVFPILLFMGDFLFFGAKFCFSVFKLYYLCIFMKLFHNISLFVEKKLKRESIFF